MIKIVIQNKEFKNFLILFEEGNNIARERNKLLKELLLIIDISLKEKEEIKNETNINNRK